MPWRQLLAIEEEARQLAEAEQLAPPQACPVCGTSPLDERGGLYHCPWGDWSGTR